MLRQGGWPIIPLAICSITALAIIVERAFALRHANVLDQRVRQVVESYQGEDSAERALHVCMQCRGPFARIIEAVLRARHLDSEHMIEKMHATGRTQIGTLERGLTVLEIIAGISPLIGLLGTVLGMVTVFDAINAQGMGNPQVLSGGISQALITTVVGLCVAIPALAFHSYFSARVEDYADEMHEIAVTFMNHIRQRR